MKVFFVRIHPARAGFLKTLTRKEKAIMGSHFAYWRQRLKDGQLILAGPVRMSPGTFGILIIRSKNLSEAERLVNQDPAVAARIQNYEIYPLKLSLYERTIGMAM